MWRIGQNFLSCIQNSALSSTFPVAFRCTKFQFCISAVGTLAVPGELGDHETLSKQASVYASSNDIIPV